MNNNQLVFDNNHKANLENQMTLLALESNFVENVIGVFRTTLPSLVQKINESINMSFFAEKPEAQIIIGKEIKSNLKSLDKKLELANFVSYKDVVVSVPQGFVGDFKQYLTFMDRIFNDVISTGNQLLSEYSYILSAFISNKENKVSLKDHTAFYKKIQVDREKISKDFDQFFDRNSDNSLQRLNKIINRFDEVEDIVEQTIKLETATKQSNLSEIQQSVKKISGLLDIIVQQTQTDSISKVSGNAAMNISKGAYEVAKFIELISVYHFKNDQAVQTTQKLLIQLNRIL